MATALIPSKTIISELENWGAKNIAAKSEKLKARAQRVILKKLCVPPPPNKRQPLPKYASASAIIDMTPIIPVKTAENTMLDTEHKSRRNVKRHESILVLSEPLPEPVPIDGRGESLL